MGGTPANTTSATTTTQELPKWITPSARALLNRGLRVSRRPYQAYSGERVAGLDPYDTVRADTEQARGYLGDTVEGRYLDPASNPYLQATYDQAARGVVDQYRRGTAAQTDARAARAGAFGGSAYDELVAANQYDLGQTLNNLATNIYGGAYANERGLQQQAASSLPGVGAPIADLERDYAQQRLDEDYANFVERRDYPLRGLDILGSVIGQSMGRAGTSTQTGPAFFPRTSPITSALGGALAGYGATQSPWGAAIGGGLGGLGGLFG